MSQPNYAPYHKRVLAYLIDVLILFIPLVVLGWLARVTALSALIQSTAVFAYTYYFLLYKNGQTIGKRLLNIKVTSLSQSGLTSELVIKREAIAKLLPSVLAALVGSTFISSLIGLYFIVSYLWPLWDSKKQTLMDRFAGTIVVTAN